MTEDLDTKLLRAFLCTSKELNFTRAAEALAITQQGLSRQIRTLERTLGRKLFERSATGVALTRDGARLVPDAEAVVAAASRLFGNVDAEDAPIRLAEIRGRHMMQDVWDLHRRRIPSAKATFSDLTGGQQLAALRNGTLDVAMTWLTDSDPHLAHRLLRLDPVVVFHVGEPRTFDLKVDRLGYARVSRESQGWERFCEQLQRDLDIELVRLPYDITMLEGIGRAQMRGEAPPMLALSGMREYPGSEAFQFSPLGEVQPFYPWSLIWHSDERNPHILEFVGSCFETAAARGWLDLPHDAVQRWMPGASPVGGPTDPPTKAECSDVDGESVDSSI